MKCNIFKQMSSNMTGYLYIQLKTTEIEKIINSCQNKNIMLSDITCTKEGYVLCISLKDLKKLKPILKKTHTRLKILKRGGVPFFINRHHNWISFTLGIVVALAIIKYLSLNIWCITFEGNLMYTDSTLYMYLKENGITEGIDIKDVDCTELEGKIRQKFPCITWVSAEIDGTKLNIMVKENEVELNKEKNTDNYCDVVSDVNGTIVSIVTRLGIPLVKSGDTVSVGDVLIKGSIEVKNEYDEYLRTDYTQADGTIIARVEYPYEDILNLSYNKKVYTGNEVTEHYVKLHNNRLSTNRKKKFDLYDTVYTQKQYMLSNNIYTPVYYGEVIYKEYYYEEASYSISEGKAILDERLNYFLENFNEIGVQIIEKNVTIEEWDGALVAKGTIVVNKPIGIPTQIIKTEEILINEHN